jgi:hypothetical protein
MMFCSTPLRTFLEDILEESPKDALEATLKDTKVNVVTPQKPPFMSL